MEEPPGKSTITTDGARLHISTNNFWGGRFEHAFMDVRVFNPHAPSNRNTSIEKCFKENELVKKKPYSQ